MLRPRLQAHPAHRRYRGWNLFEVSIVLGIVALGAVGAYGLANQSTSDVRETNMIRDVQAIIFAVSRSQLSTYEDLTKDVIIDGNRLDHKLIDSDSDEIVITGTGGNDYTVNLAGGADATNGVAVGADTDRFFIMSIQDVEELQDCVALMAFDYPTLVGVLADADDNQDAADIIAATATNSWQQPPQNTGRELIDRTAASVQAACTAAFTGNNIATVSLGIK